MWTTRDRRSSNVFRTLIKTLLKAGLITHRTRPQYALWVDLAELEAEGDRMVGDEVAEEGIRSLKEINAGKRKIVRPSRPETASRVGD